MKIILSVFLLISCSVYSQNNYSIEKNINYYSKPSGNYQENRCVLDIYYPKNKSNFATIVWFHGGGLSAGEKEIPKALKERGIAVIGVNYRLYPNIKEPVYIEDAAASVAWVFKNIKKYGGDPKKIFISGHSAGGYLTSMIGLDKKYLKHFDIDADSIAGLIPFSGHAITHFTVRKERGIDGTQPIIDNLAPLFHVRPDAPPYLMITGDRELELLGRYEENAYMMRMMKIVGHKETKLIELEGYGHNMTYPAFPILIKEIERISTNINSK